MTSFEYRNLVHRLFSSTPQLVDGLGINKLQMMEAFMEQVRPSLNWALHLHWLQFLIDNGSVLDEAIVKELIRAAAIRWSMQGLEHVEAKGILIASAFLPNKLIGLWKSQEIGKTHTLIEARINNVYPSQYALSYTVGKWGSLTWLRIPY